MSTKVTYMVKLTNLLNNTIREGGTESEPA